LSLDSLYKRRVGYYTIWKLGASGASSNGSHNTFAAEPVPYVLNEDDEGWTLVIRRRSKKKNHVQPTPFCQRKRQNRKKNPQRPKEKRLNSDKKHEVQPVNLLEQEPLSFITLEEFFPRDFFLGSL